MMPSGNKSSNDNISHSAALRESRGGSEEGELGVAWGRGGVLKGDHVCLTGVFLWMISLRLPRC